MKIAIISDIHGNSFALDAVLKKIKELKADKIYCLGDIAMAGFEPNYTIQKIASFENAVIIQGNTDKLIVNYSNELFETVKSAFPAMAYALREDVKIIEKENIEFLNKLPERLEITEMGVKICLCHGSPNSQDENMYPQTPLEEISKMVNSTNANIIFSGHTHLPCGFQLENGQTVVNVGSVGRPMQENKTPVFCIMEIFENKTFEITHHFAPYNNQLAYEKVIGRGFSNCEVLANMLLEET